MLMYTEILSNDNLFQPKKHVAENASEDADWTVSSQTPTPEMTRSTSSSQGTRHSFDDLPNQSRVTSTATNKMKDQGANKGKMWGLKSSRSQHDQ